MSKETLGQIIRESQQGVIVAVHVVPRSPRDEIAGTYGNALRIRLKAPPVEGAANAALLAFMAQVLDIPRRQVKILSGQTSRHKLLVISNLTKDQVQQKLIPNLPH
nr:YggU family protein [Chloroflexota bacterium]